MPERWIGVGAKLDTDATLVDYDYTLISDGKVRIPTPEEVKELQKEFCTGVNSLCDLLNDPEFVTPENAGSTYCFELLQKMCDAFCGGDELYGGELNMRHGDNGLLGRWLDLNLDRFGLEDKDSHINMFNEIREELNTMLEDWLKSGCTGGGDIMGRIGITPIK